MIDMHSARAFIRPLDIEVKVKTASITLDERWSPYGQVSLTCVLPDEADREAIDLREEELRLDLRVRRDFGQPWSLADLTAAGGNEVAGITTLLDGGPLANLTHLFYEPFNGSLERSSQTRSFDLTIVRRQFDDVTKELALEAETDEVLLLGDALAAATALDPSSTDLPTIVQSVLDRYDRTLLEAEAATVAEADATIWQVGDTAAGYVDPLLEAASLRLWCDEEGNFRVSQREGTTPGAVTLDSARLVGHRDQMTLDPTIWADAVIIIYTWTDALDLNNTAVDWAGEQPSRAARIIRRPGVVYPGPGAAAGMLARLQGRGRVLDVEAVADYTVTPGMAASITPPDTDTQTGYVSAVTWNLPEGEMSVVTRGLVDTPGTAYIFGPAGYSYLDVPLGISYEEFDWSMA